MKQLVQVQYLAAQKNAENGSKSTGSLQMDIPVARQRTGSCQKLQRTRNTEGAVRSQGGRHPMDLQRNISTIRSTQNAVEMPRVQLIDKIVDDPAIVQRQVTIIHDTEDPCHAATVHEDSGALNEAAEPEEQTEHENEKRRVPEPTGAVFEFSSAVCRENTDGPYFERLEEFILPPSQSCFDAIESIEEVRGDGLGGKTLFVNTASSDEVEDNAGKSGRRPKRRTRGTRKAQDTRWSQVAHEANLQEALMNKTKVVKLVRRQRLRLWQSPDGKSRLHPRKRRARRRSAHDRH